MDRPPRATPPSRFSNAQQPQSSRPNAKRDPSSAVTFQDSADRNGGGGYAGQGLQSPAGDGKYGDPANTQYDSYNSLSYQSHADDVGHIESGGGLNPADVKRKKSLVRPDRERIDPNHRQYYYRNHAVQMENDALGVMPSATGNAPQISLRRGKSVLAREEDAPDAAPTGLARFKSRKTLRRKEKSETPEGGKKRFFSSIPGPVDAWVMYCYVITACLPGALLSVFGIKTPEQQRAWREKMGLVSIILSMMAGVGFITFGFTQTVCKDPGTRVQTGNIGKSFLIVHGYAYDLGAWKHPAVSGSFTGQTNPLFEQYNAGGMDASFLFQNVNQRCTGLITIANGSSIAVDSKKNLGWYFPCNLYDQYGQTGPNLSGYDSSKNCHTKPAGRQQFAQLKKSAQVYYTWDDVRNSNRNLAVYESSILDFSLLNWLDKSQVTYPPLFDQFKAKNGTFNGKDLSMWFLRNGHKDIGACLQDIVTVGFVDTRSIGCVASEVVLYVSLVFIIGVVAIKFFMAVIFGWFVSWRLGSFGEETYQQRMARAREIEDWTDNIHSAAPAGYRPTVKQGASNWNEKRKTQFFPTQSRFSKADNQVPGKPPARPPTVLGSPARFGASSPVGFGSKTFLGVDSPAYRGSRSSTSLGDGRYGSSDPNLGSGCPYPLAKGVITQPPPDFQPYGYPLAHTICLVTAYSESVEGLRTTIDSLATTSYPNSHKLIMVIADGMVKGSGNTMTTPEIVLTMMKDFVIDPSEVQAHSYVAIADGHKRHNMAKVYAGFYAYDDATTEPSKQQRVPMVLVAKVGNPLEANEAKPGNRGKRDSQIVLMAFLQKVLFDERMTTFEYEFFNSIWRATGISPDQYEIVLCVDADTKVFPDSLSRMVACMSHDEEIMGLCGETKIANKAETWVTMIQVFEYYISHHLTKAFESMFGGVTCLPGCFSMYRIKAPKGREGFWVPILANPDIVEHYSENIVDTLHKKNLLLLGEDRYLTTLMLKTFPKRKMVFCPQAVCKTIVPDTFSVLLSQRRRWINSTVHNLAELLLVRDLCGTFCFSMQFVVFMELAGTLVLPAAISFTLYLIIYAVLPSTKEKPIIPLILLAIILGLPGLLIVVTSRKVEYLGWMLIYLLSLPIWNAVLPAYAFWHFDDFSWGQTRMVAGEKAGDDKHGDKDGEFDSSHIVMKRWAEFERDRRFKSGTHSRDSTYGDVIQRTGTGADTPRRESRRFSVVSGSEVSDAFASRGLPFGNPPMGFDSEAANSPHYRSRGDLMLPAPLSVAMPPRTKFGRDGSPVSSATRVDEEPYNVYDTGSNHRLIPSPADNAAGQDEQTSSTEHAPSSRERYTSPQPSGVNVAAVIAQQQGVRHGNVAANNYPGETPNPYRYSLPQAASPSAGFYNDLQDDLAPPTPAKNRGVSLVDQGVVPTGSSGERRIPRPSARRHSAKPEPTPYAAQPYQEEAPRSRPSSYRPPAGPPPGAASPVPPQSRGWNDPRYQ
ncbi:Chitin synthase, class 3 [Tulasnella sp. 424]|nr:Chitin synthase, class 3 [Tulasnella sp. 424]KAG8971328.1 Chitin synthase, class 3 [Tulasnella sp. 425]